MFGRQAHCGKELGLGLPPEYYLNVEANWCTQDCSCPRKTWSSIYIGSETCRLARYIYFRGFESYKDAQTPRDHRVLQDMQVTQSGCGMPTDSESNAGSIRRQINVENLKIISGWVVSFANPPPFRMLKVRGG